MRNRDSRFVGCGELETEIDWPEMGTDRKIEALLGPSKGKRRGLENYENGIEQMVLFAHTSHSIFFVPPSENKKPVKSVYIGKEGRIFYQGPVADLRLVCA